MQEIRSKIGCESSILDFGLSIWKSDNWYNLYDTELLRFRIETKVTFSWKTKQNNQKLIL